jgi:hypothetical protein
MDRFALEDNSGRNTTREDQARNARRAAAGAHF